VNTTYYVLQKQHGLREGGYAILNEDGGFSVTFRPELATRFTSSRAALRAVAERAILYTQVQPWNSANAHDDFQLVEIIYILPPPQQGTWKIGRAL